MLRGTLQRGPYMATKIVLWKKWLCDETSGSAAATRYSNENSAATKPVQQQTRYCDENSAVVKPDLKRNQCCCVETVVWG